MAEKKIKNKKLIYLTLFFIILLVYFLIFEKKIQEKESKKNNLFQYVIADVKKFEIQKQSRVIIVERVLNDWIIRKPYQLPASKIDIDAFLSDVCNLQKLEIIGKNLPDLNNFGLENPKLVFKIWLGQELVIFNLGNQNPDKSGYYAKFSNSPDVFLIEPVCESTIDKEIFYFRDKRIFTLNIEDIKLFTFKDNNRQYTLTKENNEWAMKEPIQYSGAGVEIEIKKILNNVIDISIKKFFDNKQHISISDAGLLSPDKVIKLIDNKNQSIRFNIGKEVSGDSNQYYAKLGNKNLIFSVDKNIIDDLNKDLKKLEDEKIKKDKEKKDEKKKENEERMKKSKEDINEKNKKK